MQPKFVTLPEIKIVGVYGKFNSVMSPDKNNMIVIPKLWQNYMPRRHEIKNTKSKNDLGVCLPVPEKERSNPAECAYMACAEVTSFENVPEGMTTFTIPEGEYVVFTHKGALDTYEQTLGYIYGTWLPQSGRQMRMAPDIEMYDHRFKLNDPSSELDIYIPIE